MVQQGLVDEVSGLIAHQELNALKTVGYRELFDYFSGKSSLELGYPPELARRLKRQVKEVIATFIEDAHHRKITVTVRGIDLSLAQAGGGH